MDRFDPPPALLAALADRWQLDVGPPLEHDGILAWVARVRRGDERLVLKLTHRTDDEARDEAAGLRAWDGAGAVRLLDAYEHDGVAALLLEDCVPGTSLSTRPPEEQDEILAALLKRLWTTPGAGFRPLSGMCAWWADSARDKGVPDEFADGLDDFRALPLESDDDVLLATDLHAGNILAAEREPWLVIDPKPYTGDRHYDATQHLLNNPERLQANPLAWVDRMSRLLDLDRTRLRRWMYARCVLHHSQSPGRPYLLDVARRLRT